MTRRVRDRAALALQGHPVPLNLLLLRKSCLTPDGIMRQLTPISMPGWKPSRMPPTCSPAKPSYEPGALIPVARPARFLSFRAAHVNARG